MDTIESLLKKGKTIKKGLKAKRNVKVSYRDPEMTFLETVLARGDRSISSVILGAWKRGARFDGWNDQFDFSRWSTSADDNSIDLTQFVSEIPVEQVLPWSVVSTGITSEFLLRERERALNGEITADCRNNPCYECGVCIDNEVQSVIAPSTTKISTVQGSPLLKKTDSEKHYFYRVTYEKGKEVRFVSHKNLVNIFHRAFKASGIPVAYSKGFHPHPKIAFGQPLAVGLIGKEELFDLVTTDKIALTNNMVKAWLPKGLRIKKSNLMAKKPVSLSVVTVAAEYSFKPRDVVDNDQLADAIKDLLARKSVYIKKESKGKQVEMDIRPFIYELKLEKKLGAVYIKAVLSMLPGKTCRPADLIPCLLPGKKAADFTIIREACLQDIDGGLEKI
jgi:radical SAM-linked protein